MVMNIFLKQKTKQKQLNECWEFSQQRYGDKDDDVTDERAPLRHLQIQWSSPSLKKTTENLTF